MNSSPTGTNAAVTLVNLAIQAPSDGNTTASAPCSVNIGTNILRESTISRVPPSLSNLNASRYAMADESVAVKETGRGVPRLDKPRLEVGQEREYQYYEKEPEEVEAAGILMSMHQDDSRAEASVIEMVENREDETEDEDVGRHGKVTMRVTETRKGKEVERRSRFGRLLKERKALE
jgi:hypothetical protein